MINLKLILRWFGRVILSKTLFVVFVSFLPLHCLCGKCSKDHNLLQSIVPHAGPPSFFSGDALEAVKERIPQQIVASMADRLYHQGIGAHTSSNSSTLLPQLLKLPLLKCEVLSENLCLYRLFFFLYMHTGHLKKFDLNLELQNVHSSRIHKVPIGTFNEVGPYQFFTVITDINMCSYGTFALSHLNLVQKEESDKPMSMGDDKKKVSEERPLEDHFMLAALFLDGDDTFLPPLTGNWYRGAHLLGKTRGPYVSRDVTFLWGKLYDEFLHPKSDPSRLSLVQNEFTTYFWKHRPGENVATILDQCIRFVCRDGIPESIQTRNHLRSPLNSYTDRPRGIDTETLLPFEEERDVEEGGEPLPGAVSQDWIRINRSTSLPCLFFSQRATVLHSILPVPPSVPTSRAHIPLLIVSFAYFRLAQEAATARLDFILHDKKGVVVMQHIELFHSVAPKSSEDVINWDSWGLYQSWDINISSRRELPSIAIYEQLVRIIPIPQSAHTLELRFISSSAINSMHIRNFLAATLYLPLAVWAGMNPELPIIICDDEDNANQLELSNGGMPEPTTETKAPTQMSNAPFSTQTWKKVTMPSPSPIVTHVHPDAGKTTSHQMYWKLPLWLILLILLGVIFFVCVTIAITWDWVRSREMHAPNWLSLRGHYDADTMLLMESVSGEVTHHNFPLGSAG